MMSWEFTFFAIILGMVFFIVLMIVIMVLKIHKAAKDVGIEKEDVKAAIDATKEGFMGDAKPKQIPGMTDILEPLITKDFPSFGKEMIFVKTEDCLRSIFNALTTKDKTKLDKVMLIRGVIENAIDDYISNNINVSFSDVKFHKFTISKYEKLHGVASINVETSCEYIFTKEQNGKKIAGSNDKLQTAYTCTFIYIYDETILDDEYLTKVVAMNCPNCGAPIRSFKQENCLYCHTALNIPIKNVNIRGWELASYEERK